MNRVAGFFILLIGLPIIVGGLVFLADEIFVRYLERKGKK